MTEKHLVVDTESTTFQKGNPFATRNRLCYIGSGSNGKYNVCDVRILDRCQEKLDNSIPWVGFNIKYDLHWLLRFGHPLPHRVWDCQYAHFLLTAQKESYPSLDGVAAHYGLGSKLSTVASDYWDKGIDTDAIPVDVIVSYNKQDLALTEQVYHKQRAALEKNEKLYRLFRLHMQDLLVLQEMEYNGLKLNVEACQKEEEKINERLKTIDAELQLRCPNCPINWDSVDHVSSYLYGGSIIVDRKEPNGVYATGDKAGQIKYKWFADTYPMVRLVEPLKGSELKKEGYWSTSEDVLKQVKQAPQVGLLLERAKLGKLKDYIGGLPTLMMEKDWSSCLLHGQYNQCVARTGRLSSSGPNLQNLPDAVLKLIESRYV